ncbi:hypothetical protein RhiirA5_438417 [Rhizophagus irregularis]|uniref:F-box domain-containing protein n=1 Tax=Rhizophagus irregularis TaxID=588596 RepID=A0A2N0NJ69_9GLOM|nr:hypothetical protein RhiirA5_438417 [Rhizophagus irregularis]
MESDQPGQRYSLNKALRVKHLTSLTNISPKSSLSETSSSESSSSESSSSESSSSESGSSETSSSESSLSESSSFETSSSESSSSDSDIDEIDLSNQNLKNARSINNIWEREVDLEWSKRKTLFDFQTGSSVQGNNMVKDFSSKLKEYKKSVGYHEERLKWLFLKGISPENTFKVFMDHDTTYNTDYLARGVPEVLHMTHSTVFYLPELLERILYFLAIDKSLYPTLFVSRLWYRYSAPILWKRIELKGKDLYPGQSLPNDYNYLAKDHPD